MFPIYKVFIMDCNFSSSYIRHQFCPSSNMQTEDRQTPGAGATFVQRTRTGCLPSPPTPQSHLCVPPRVTCVEVHKKEREKMGHTDKVVFLVVTESIQTTDTHLMVPSFKQNKKSFHVGEGFNNNKGIFFFFSLFFF